MYDVIQDHGGSYTVELYKALCVECIIPYKEQHSILVCYEMANHHPEQLEMMEPVGGIDNKTDYIKS